MFPLAQNKQQPLFFPPISGQKHVHIAPLAGGQNAAPVPWQRIPQWPNIVIDVNHPRDPYFPLFAVHMPPLHVQSRQWLPHRNNHRMIRVNEFAKINRIFQRMQQQ